jgi:glyoxylase-like metal-dependent hydrolase (beta-lactamase superfamily II)
MKRLLIVGIGVAALALWAQAPPEGAGAGKGKGKAGATDAAKGKAGGRGVITAEAKAPTPPPIPQVLRLVRANTYLVTGHGTNSVFRVTPQGVILVDTKLAGPGDYERLVELIRGITPQPVKFVINTSMKPEASGNNAKFQAAGAELVSGERALTLGGAEARAIRVGESTAVYFPGEKLLCLGDASKTNDAVSKLDWTLAVQASGEPVYR